MNYFLYGMYGCTVCRICTSIGRPKECMHVRYNVHFSAFCPVFSIILPNNHNLYNANLTRMSPQRGSDPLLNELAVNYS